MKSAREEPRSPVAEEPVAPRLRRRSALALSVLVVLVVLVFAVVIIGTSAPHDAGRRGAGPLADGGGQRRENGGPVEAASPSSSRLSSWVTEGVSTILDGAFSERPWDGLTATLEICADATVVPGVTVVTYWGEREGRALRVQQIPLSPEGCGLARGPRGVDVVLRAWGQWIDLPPKIPMDRAFTQIRVGASPICRIGVTVLRKDGRVVSGVRVSASPRRIDKALVMEEMPGAITGSDGAATFDVPCGLSQADLAPGEPYSVEAPARFNAEVGVPPPRVELVVDPFPITRLRLVDDADLPIAGFYATGGFGDVAHPVPIEGLDVRVPHGAVPSPLWARDKRPHRRFDDERAAVRAVGDGYEVVVPLDPWDTLNVDCDLRGTVLQPPVRCGEHDASTSACGWSGRSLTCPCRPGAYLWVGHEQWPLPAFLDPAVLCLIP